MEQAMEQATSENAACLFSSNTTTDTRTLLHTRDLCFVTANFADTLELADEPPSVKDLAKKYQSKFFCLQTLINCTPKDGRSLPCPMWICRIVGALHSHDRNDLQPQNARELISFKDEGKRISRNDSQPQKAESGIDFNFPYCVSVLLLLQGFSKIAENCNKHFKKRNANSFNANNKKNSE
mmetsp:Transcript_28131/g.52799  ORF Transcript_28131/g.52799 Transcript_28131/m.52799 type:complete len:181 (-) Transcript_28131:373-915(-)